MNTGQMQTAVLEFAQRVSGLELDPPFVERVVDLTKEKQWNQSWSAKPGIYCFICDDELVYVGRATPTTNLGGRIADHLKQRQNEEWKNVITNANSLVHLWVFPEDQWHWLAALELVLIDQEPRPVFNKRL